MPRLSKIRSSRIKRARHASEISRQKRQLRLTDNSQPLAASPADEEHDSQASTCVQVPIRVSENELAQQVYTQYTTNCPRVKDQLFRLTVLRVYFYQIGSLKLSKSESLKRTCQIFMVGSSTIRRWLCLFRETGSPCDIPSDSIIGRPPVLDDSDMFLLDTFVKTNAISIQNSENTKRSLTAAKILQWVQDELGKEISASSLRRSLLQLNYRWLDSSIPDSRASYNKIGYDRSDVLFYRHSIFLKKVIQNYRDPNVVFICHDECMVHCNMHSLYYYVKCSPTGKKWHDSDQKRFAQKFTNRGKNYSVMIGGFLSEDGFCLDTLVRLKRGGIYRNPTYKNEDVCSDFVKAIDVFKDKYPEKTLVFLFDNAPSHKTKTKINTKNYNLTVYTQDEVIPQCSKEYFLRQSELWTTSMEKLPEPPKPSISLLSARKHHMPNDFTSFTQWKSHLKTEWKDWREWKKKQQAIEKQIDSTFVNCVSWKNFDTKLESIAKKHNVKILFTPFYHAGLNPIELYWGRMKNILRSRQLTSLKTIYDAIPEIIEEINNRGFAQKCFRRIIGRVAQYQQYRELRLSYYQYKETVLSKSPYKNPWSPENRSKHDAWLLGDD